MTSPKNLSVVMIGASGAVGSALVQHLQASPRLERLTLISRKINPDLKHPKIEQHALDPLNPSTYAHILKGHQAAVCTLGVGQPSKMSKEEFLRIDRDAVIAFATASKHAGVAHFELLASVDANAKSRSFYLRTKGELCDALQAMQFERLTIAAPSMILTPSNRYGFTQALTLKFWPKLNPMLRGGWQRYRGIDVDILGKAMAENLSLDKQGQEVLHWQDFIAFAKPT